MPQVKKAIEVLEDDLIPSSPSTESKIFNLKMLGDCYRYIAQSVTNVDKAELESVVLKSWKAYEEASRFVVPALSPTHPIRLGLAMSMALFQHDILSSPERALYLLHHAWTEGSAEIDTITEEMWKDSALMLQRVRNNLTLWASDLQDAREDIDDPEFD
ncbi:14-3-3 protein, partial [Gymnopilus junonius]